MAYEKTTDPGDWAGLLDVLDAGDPFLGDLTGFDDAIAEVAFDADHGPLDEGLARARIAVLLAQRLTYEVDTLGRWMNLEGGASDGAP